MSSSIAEMSALKAPLETANPFIPPGFKMLSNKGSSDPVIIEYHDDMLWVDGKKIILHRVLGQGENDGYLSGEEVYETLLRTCSQNILNASILDFLIVYPDFMPESWKEKYLYIVFWGTIYIDADGFRYVRYIKSLNGHLHDGTMSLGNMFTKHRPAALVSP